MSVVPLHGHLSHTRSSRRYRWSHFINGGSANAESGRVAAFRRGLSETGYIEDQNVRVEYHGLEGHYARVPALPSECRHPEG
jgi:hypothetical protein